MALLTDPGPFQVLISDPGPVQEPVGSGWDAFWEGAFAGALAVSLVDNWGLKLHYRRKSVLSQLVLL